MIALQKKQNTLYLQVKILSASSVFLSSNKRISVTPISLVAGGSDLTSYVPVAEAMDRAAKAVGVNFIGGFSALVTKGATRADRILIDSIPGSIGNYGYRM